MEENAKRKRKKNEKVAVYVDCNLPLKLQWTLQTTKGPLPRHEFDDEVARRGALPLALPLRTHLATPRATKPRKCQASLRQHTLADSFLPLPRTEAFFGL